VCILCKGIPKIKKIKCKRCQGSGYKNTADGYSFCSACGGNKSFSKPTCDCCSGKGHMEKSVYEMIFIPPGLKNNEEITLEGKGHQHIKRGFFGNLVITVKLEGGKTEETPAFRKDGYNTHANVKISLLDAIFGAKITYNTVWGSRTIALHAGIQNGDLLKRAGEGLKKKSKK
jgi:DnaJ-class molecular chaperone